MAREMFKDCEEAAALLMDPKKRAIYDKFGMRGTSLIQKSKLEENDDIIDSFLEREDILAGVDYPKGKTIPEF